MMPKTHLFFGMTVVEAPLKDAEHLIGTLCDNADLLESVHLHIEDPVEEFMGALAWPPGGCFRTLAGLCMRKNVELYRVGRRITFEDLFKCASSAMSEGELGFIARAGVRITTKPEELSEYRPGALIALPEKVWGFRAPVSIEAARKAGLSPGAP